MAPSGSTLALADIRGLAAASRLRITRHAWARMTERGVQYDDVRHCLSGATSCAEAEHDRWTVQGADCVGEPLAVVVVLEAEVVVVTVF